MRALQILVIGYNSDYCTEIAYDIAYKTGREIALSNNILITGGLGGVMEAACKGAIEHNGLTIGIIPYEDINNANKYCKVVICTGIGYARNYINVYSSDGVIIIGGGVGTLIEAGIAYMKRKPIVAIRGSGGIADNYIDKYIDERNLIKIKGVNTPKEAVDFIIEYYKNKYG